MKSNYSRLLTGCIAIAAIFAAAANQYLGKILNVVPHPDSVTIESEKGSVRIIPLDPNIIRIETLPAGSGETFQETGMTLPDDFLPGYQIVADKGGVSVITPSTEIYADRETSLLSFYNSDGHLLLEESEAVNNGKGKRTAVFSGIESDENLYGSGERGHSFRLNGDSLLMYNKAHYGYADGDPRISYMNISVPYFASDYGYGVLFDDHSKATMILGDTVKFISDSPDPLAYYFLNSNDGSLAGVTESYTSLTGRQPLTPFWALGYITSKYGYHNEKETTGAVDSLLTRGYPLDGVILDLYWYGQETDMGRFDWNKEQFPEPEKMLADLRKKGVKTVLITQPYLNKKGAIDNYNELEKAGMLTKDASGRTKDITTWVGDAGMLDVSNPDTRAWMWNKYRKLTESGVEGWWGDLGEPEVHPSEIVHHNGMSADHFHNFYGNSWSSIVSDGFKKDFPDKRLFLMMRGGTAGLQRNSVFPWSSDVSRSWGGLSPQVRIMLNSGLSGLAYMSSDIGGFAVDPAHPYDSELYVRWIQLGTFSPILRTHAQDRPEPYHYPAQEKIIKKFIRQRYEWLPYNYTLAYENALTGAPLVRPLNFNGENTTLKYAQTDDEYMWGNEILVAPVLKKGARSRSVLFPSGTWINWNNPAVKYKGGTTATVPAPLDELPMFVREGSFIPLYTQEIKNTGQYDPRFLTVRYFPSEEETYYTLFDDDRQNPYSIEEGRYQLTTFSGYSEKGLISVSTESNGGIYEGMPSSRELTFEIIGVPKRPAYLETSGGIPLTDSDDESHAWSYDSRTKTLKVRVQWEYAPLTIHCHF